MKLSKIMGVAISGLAVAASLGACTEQPAPTPQQVSAMSTLQTQLKADKLTEASYRVLFNRNGCEFGQYTPYKAYTDGSGRFYEGSNVHTVICPNGSGQSSTVVGGGSKHGSSQEEVVSMSTGATAATPSATP